GAAEAVPVTDRYQHGLLHGRQFWQRGSNGLHNHRQRGESCIAVAVARPAWWNSSEPRNLFFGQGSCFSRRTDKESRSRCATMRSVLWSTTRSNRATRSMKSKKD